jgi:hypothetical protein
MIDKSGARRCGERAGESGSSSETGITHKRHDGLPPVKKDALM